MDQAGDDGTAAARAPVLQQAALAEPSRDQHWSAFSQLFDVPAAHIARHLYLVAGVGPEQPRVLGVGDRELDPHDEDRSAARTAALPGSSSSFPVTTA